MKRLDDILDYNLKIYQNDDYFCYSTDSIMLARLVNIRIRDKKILDIGTGNAIIPLVLSLRTKNKIEAVEIQKDLVDLANDSIKINDLEEQIKVYNQNIIDFCEKSKYNTYDLIVCNPPYFKKTTKKMDYHKLVARHEELITISEIVAISSKLLKERGKLALINRTDRFMEVMEILKNNKIEPKIVRFIYDNSNLDSSMFFVEGIKNAKVGLKIMKPLIMYDDKGKETVEYLKVLEG